MSKSEIIKQEIESDKKDNDNMNINNIFEKKI